MGREPDAIYSPSATYMVTDGRQKLVHYVTFAHKGIAWHVTGLMH